MFSILWRGSIEGLVIVERDLSAFDRWNAGVDAFGCQGLAEPVAVVAAVGDQGFRQRQRVEHEAGALVVAHLAFGEQQDERLAVAVADGMQLGVQPAFGASDTAGNIPFLSRLAAVR